MTGAPGTLCGLPPCRPTSSRPRRSSVSRKINIGPGCCRIGMMTAERIPRSSVDRNPADLARRAATAGPSSGRSVGAGPTAARTQSTVAHDVVRQGRLGGERGGEGAGSGAAGVGSRCIRGSQMAGTVVLSGGAPERRPTAWVRLGQRAKRIAPVYITGRTRRPARALPRRGTGWAGSS
jgi:hypothetical protein